LSNNLGNNFKYLVKIHFREIKFVEKNTLTPLNNLNSSKNHEIPVFTGMTNEKYLTKKGIIYKVFRKA